MRRISSSNGTCAFLRQSSAAGEGSAASGSVAERRACRIAQHVERAHVSAKSRGMAPPSAKLSMKSRTRHLALASARWRCEKTDRSAKSSCAAVAHPTR